MSFPRILLASTFAFSAAIAPAEHRPGNHKPGNVEQEAATSADTSARDPASGLPTGKRMHKPLTLTWRCDTHDAQPANGVASDPEEGGQIARAGGRSSDPEEGAELTTASRSSKSGKVNIHDMQVTKHVDKSSTTLMDGSQASVSNCH